MKTAHKNYLSLFTVLLFAVFATVAGGEYLEEVREDVLYDRQVAQIADASGIDAMSAFHDKVDNLRIFINENTQHLEDDEFFAIWQDDSKMAANVIDYLEGRRKELPHFECSTRANLMANILQSKGYRVRSIDLYHGGSDLTLSGHAALDVFNPETARWETQDPEYDAYWKNTKTGERTTAAEAAIAPDTVRPCNAKDCGWHIKSREGADGEALKVLISYVTTIDRDSDERITFRRPDIAEDAPLILGEKTGGYCDLLEKNCKDGFYQSSAENLKRIMD